MFAFSLHKTSNIFPIVYPKKYFQPHDQTRLSPVYTLLFHILTKIDNLFPILNTPLCQNMHVFVLYNMQQAVHQII